MPGGKLIEYSPMFEVSTRWLDRFPLNTIVAFGINASLISKTRPLTTAPPAP